MGADSTVAFLGVRYELDEDQIEELEDRRAPIFQRARKAGLSTYWGNFGGSSERYLLFVGERLGVLGVENDREVEVEAAQLVELSQAVRERLRQAGFDGEPRIHLQLQEDA